MKRVTDPELLRQLDGGGEASAPAGLKPVTDERILFELNNAAPEKREQSMTDRVKRQLGLTLRAGVQGVTALPNMLGDVAGLQSTRAVSDLLTKLGVPLPENATERVVQDVAGAMAGQGGTMTLGQGMTKAVGPVAQRVGDLLTSGRGVQTAAAAAGPAAGGIVREQGGSPGAQLAANLGATIAVPMAAGMVKHAPQQQSVRDLLAEAKKRDVDLSYADITKGSGARRLDTMLEQAPVVGTSGFREQGAKKVTAAMEGFADDALVGMRSTEFRGMKALEKAAASGDKPARALLEQIKNSGDDWTKIMQTSGNLKLWRSKQAADALYDRVEALAKTRGEVPLSRTNAAIDAAIAAESKSVLPDKSLVAKLNEIKAGLYGNDPAKRVRDFGAIRALRSDLGKIIDGYFKGSNAVVAEKGVGPLQALKNAVDADLEAFATTNGDDLMRSWKRADSFYRNAVVPFKDRQLAQALKSDLPDEIYKKFIQVSRSGAGEDRAIKFYDALDPKGKAAVRYGMIANAIDSATIPENQGLLSPAKFEQALQNIDPAAKTFFRGEAKKELDAFVNLMEHARRFGQFKENPPTGQRVIPWLALGGAAIRPVEVAAVGAGAYVTRLLVTTETGKRLLLDAARLRPGTPEMQRVVEEISKQIPRIASQQQEQTSTGQQPQRSQRQQGAAAGAMQ